MAGSADPASACSASALRSIALATACRIRSSVNGAADWFISRETVRGAGTTCWSKPEPAENSSRDASGSPCAISTSPARSARARAAGSLTNVAVTRASAGRSPQ
ncbi:hypothetical protein BJF90_12515 [Pseudonocardia sp. CNS-004]|nr:hypothetical protein BJF90_12515 [Pseudonocardia sp. CNS-004]